MRRHTRIVLGAALAAVVLGGCGSPALWARYQAERQFWQARRLADRAQLNPKAASDGDLAKAEAAFTAIARRWPAAEWAQPERLAEPYRSDVARLSGEAAVAVAKIEEARGRLDSALVAYEDAERAYAAVLPVRLEAALGRASALQRAGDPRAATMVESLAREFPLVDPATGQALDPVLGALVQVVQDHAAHQRLAAVDSALHASVSRLEHALTSARGTRAAPPLWLLLAQLHAARGPSELAPALDALRSAMAEPEAKKQRPQLALLLGEYSLAGGQRDTALAYARWAEHLDGGKAAPDALLLQGRIWEQFGVADSAISAYSRFIDQNPSATDAISVARFHRAVLFEATNRWEQARSEYRALSAQNPSHELALQSYLRIVGHHLQHGERDLAQMEGKNGVGRLDQLIATYHDDEILMKAREARARLLLAIENYPTAFEALTDLWSRYGTSQMGAFAALEAAHIAETQLHDRARALELYGEVVQRATDPQAQSRARAERARLTGSRG